MGSMKHNYYIIPFVTLLTAMLGNVLTGSGMDWYLTIKLPSFTPPGYVIGIVWTVIFILSTIGTIIYWNRVPHHGKFWWAIGFLIANAVLNVMWSLLFFNLHLILAAFIEAIVLALSVLAIIVLMWPKSKLAAAFFVPYLLWVSFASYLTYAVWAMN